MNTGFFKPSVISQSKAPPSLMARCGACGIFKTCCSPKMPVTGDGERGVLVVAEAPGKDEDERGEQLIGDAGQELRRALRQIDVDLDRDCWKTNALICRPPKNRTPSAAEIGYCRPNLLQTVEELQPRTVVLLGGSAVQSLVGHLWREAPGPVGRWVGWQIPDQQINAWVHPTWHPSYLLRQKGQGNEAALRLWWGRHLEAAFAKTDRPWPDGPPDYKRQVERMHNPQDAAAVLRELARLGPEWVAAFDYETDRIKPDAADRRVLCASVAWGRGPLPDRCIAFPWTAETREASRDFLWSPCRKVASNLQFEERWTLAEFGRGVRNWWHDTMLGAHLADNRSDACGLKFQAYARLGYGAYDDHISQFLKPKASQAANRALRDIEMADLLLYCGEDSLLEYIIAWHQREEMGL